jgi:hypothetical protein
MKDFELDSWKNGLFDFVLTYRVLLFLIVRLAANIRPDLWWKGTVVRME